MCMDGDHWGLTLHLPNPRLFWEKCSIYSLKNRLTKLHAKYVTYFGGDVKYIQRMYMLECMLVFQYDNSVSSF